MSSTRMLTMAKLRYDKRMLDDIVLLPLQHFKLELGRRLTATEVAQMKVHLSRDLQNDILVKVTDGEDLIMRLDQYFGVDNVHLLERLLSLIECHDLLNALLDWKETDYPVRPEMFRECNYFPLWIKIVSDISWFFLNKSGILRSLKILLEIPEIDAEDEDLDPLVLMSVTSSKRSTLLCVLLPFSMRRHVKMLLQDSSVGIALERLRIRGIYFGRKLRSSRGGQDNLSVSSSILTLTDHFDESINDGRSNGLASYATPEAQPAHHYDSKYQDVCFDSDGYANSSIRNGPERSHHGFEPVEHGKDQSQTNFAQQYYPTQPDEYVPSLGDAHHPTFQQHSDVSSPRNPDSFEGVINGMVKVRPQLTYINHEVYKVPTHGGFESTGKDELFAQPETGFLSHSRDYGVEENVVPAKPPEQTYSLYEPLLSERSQVDGPEKAESTSSEPASGRNALLTNGKSYVSKLVIPINAENSEPRRYSARAFPVHSRHEEEPLEEAPYRQSYDGPVSNPTEPSFARREDFSLVEQAPSWDGFPGNFEENARMNSGNWYEGNEDARHRMQPEPEATHFQEGPSRFQEQASRFQENTPRFQEDDQFETMQPEPEQNLFEVEDDLVASRRHDHSSIPQHHGGPNQNSEVEVVKVRSMVLEQPQARHTPHYLSDGSVHSLDEGTNFNSNFLHPVPLTLPRVAPEQRDGSYFSPARSRTPGEDAQRDSPSIYRRHQEGSLEASPRLPQRFVRNDAELQSDYADSVFTDTTSRSERDCPSYAPPPYNPPPDYRSALKKKRSVRSLDGSTTSTETLERVARSPLLSAESISSIYKEKERFLSRDELDLSVRSAEEKEEERLVELCKELLTAAKGGDEEEVKKLLAEGANMDYQNEFGHTAAMIASREGHLEVIEVLVAARADLNKQEWFGKSALHEAAWSGQHQVVHRLISAGATIDITDEEQRTPLHYAAMRGKRRIAEVFLLFGADVSLLNKNGKSAVEVAYSYEHDDIVDVLLASQDKRMRREMETRLRKEKLRTLRSAASLPNLVKATSIRELARSKSRPDVRGNDRKKPACVIQ